MAVMEQGITFEKPVPSSEKMSLDFGSPNPGAVDSTSDLAPESLNISALNENSKVAEINGLAFASNQGTIAATSIDIPIDSESPLPGNSHTSEIHSMEQPDLSQLAETTTTTTISDDAQQLLEVQNTSLLDFNAPENVQAVAIDSVTDEVISSALEDIAPASTIPPIVEAQESDLRDTTSTLALPLEAHQDSLHTSSLKSEPDQSIDMMDGAFETNGENVTTNGDNLPYHHTPTHPNTDSSPHLDEGSLHTEQLAISQDAEMADVPESATFTKVAREREEDGDEEPSAKRTKTENDNAPADIPVQDLQIASQTPAEEAKPAPETPAAPNGEATPVNSNEGAGPSAGATTISPYLAKEIIKILKNVVRSTNGKNFRGPVKVLWPAFAESYSAVISHPVDFATMEAQLKEEKYPTLDDFKAEVELLYENALKFNKEGHEVTKAGKIVRDSILNKIENIAPEPVPKPKKQRISTPAVESTPRVSAPRRQSKSGGAPPIATATFALDPQNGTPLIRRDSTKGEGGRPKREIHAPKKDLPYNTNSRPKNKKVTQELRFCQEVLDEMKKSKHAAYSIPFMSAVDPVMMNIPHYFSVIKHPMDLSLVESNLKNGLYNSTKDFEKDVKLIFSNCYKFNPADNHVHKLGKTFEAVFNQAWANKSKWFADHAPVADSPSSNGGSDDEESEEEVEAEDPAANSALTIMSQRLNEEQDKLIALLSNPKKSAQMVEFQQEIVNMLKEKIEKATPPAPKKTAKKKSTTKPAIKKAPTKKASTAKKSSSSKGRKYLGTREKNIISNGIGDLPENISNEILAIIKSENEVVEGVNGEIELDIDSVSQPSLWKIYDWVLQYNPGIVDELDAMDEAEEAPPVKPAKPPTKKKNKPMSKFEQEAKIEQLEGRLETFQRVDSGSQEPVPTVEHPEGGTGEESSGDDSESDSEED